jgi:hypothetical protein
MPKYLLSVVLLIVGVPFQSADECKRCDCSTYPQPDDTCTKCCFIQKGVIESKSESSVTITPVRPEAKPVPRTFKLSPRTPITGELRVGENATVYYHKVDGQDVATRIELTDYIDGQLTPDSLPTPQNACSRSGPLPPNATLVLLGSNGVVGFGYYFTVLKIGDTDVIAIQRTKQGMLFSAKLFNSSGQVTAQIVDNHFFVNAKGAFRIEQAPNHHSLKIFYGDTTLVDIQFMNPSTVRVLGTLYGPHGTRIDITPDEMTVNRHAHYVETCVSGAGVAFSVAEPKN